MRRLHAASTDPGRVIPGTVQTGDLDHITGVGGVDELVIADINADVTEPVEEDKVARLQLVARNRRPVVVLRCRMVGQADAVLAKDIRNESRAVKSTR